MKTLGEIFEIGSGGTPSKTHPEYYDGNIPWVKTGDLKDEYLYSVEDCISEDGLNNSSAKMYPSGTVLIAMYGATIGATSILKFDACTNQACAAFKPCEEVLPEYLYYFLRSKKQKFISDGVGGAQPNISAGYLKKVSIDIRNIEEQEKIVTVLDKLNGIIQKRQNEVDELDELIKARFVEMFGDPIVNSEKLPTMPMTEVCEIIDGDRGKNYPTAEEFLDDGYCLFLNAKNVTASGFNFDSCMFVSKEKDEALRKGKLSRGDVVLTTRGTLGNLAFYTDEIPFEHVRINSGMVILRMKQRVVDEIYFIEQFKLQLDDIKEKIASGSAQPQLPISTMNKIQIIISDIDRQKGFADFVRQVDKSKVVVQKALNEMELLYNRMMQEFFG